MKSTQAFRRVTGIEFHLLRLCIITRIWWLGLKLYRNPFTSLKVVFELVHGFSRMLDGRQLKKAFRTHSGYRWDMFNPSWPSKGFDRFFTSHLVEIKPSPSKRSPLRRLLVAITKRCPLHCEHCSEASTLNEADVLSVQEYINRIQPLVQAGVGQLVYSGGEPLARFDDLIALIRHFKDECDQWVYTSAFGLTKERAYALKEAGIDGVAISLDQHEEEGHNLFRRSKHSYSFVINAIQYLQEVGIFVAINVCPSRTYIEANGVEQMIALLKSKNIPIINLLEPRAVGNYAGKDVELRTNHHQHLLQLSQHYLFETRDQKDPSVLYPAGYRSFKACGGGISYLHLDHDGKLYPCPFCKTQISDSLPKPEKAYCEAAA
jgi:MoaA/NifB/PqqE/SkfB family radical SAM enzyme